MEHTEEHAKQMHEVAEWYELKQFEREQPKPRVQWRRTLSSLIALLFTLSAFAGAQAPWAAAERVAQARWELHVLNVKSALGAQAATQIGYCKFYGVPAPEADPFKDPAWNYSIKAWDHSMSHRAIDQCNVIESKLGTAQARIAARAAARDAAYERTRHAK